MRLSQVLETKEEHERGLITAEPGTTLQQAVELLCGNRVGALLVIDPETRNLVGIVSERDVLRKCSEDVVCTSAVSIDSIMTRDVIVSHPEDDVHNALGVMSNKHIRHLPIIDGEKVAGIVSIGDILRALYEEDELKIHQLGDFLGGTYGCKVY